MPLSTLIALALNRVQNGSDHDAILMAKSIFVAIPLSLLFFIPFLFAEKLQLSFWASYFMGSALLVAAFFIHKYFF